MSRTRGFNLVFFFNDTATTEIYTLSLHDALPISLVGSKGLQQMLARKSLVLALALVGIGLATSANAKTDRKSTRLNSSHQIISYAVFCLKKTTGNRHRNSHNSTFVPSTPRNFAIP